MALRVLIVEDNLITREMLKEMLSILGHEAVGEAEDLQGALAAYQQHQPDAVTVDLSLPREDGLTILKGLRRAHPDAKVVIISGNSQEGIREAALQAGAFDLLAKPIELDTLRTCVERITAHGNDLRRPEGNPPAR